MVGDCACITKGLNQGNAGSAGVLSPPDTGTPMEPDMKATPPTTTINMAAANHVLRLVNKEWLGARPPDMGVHRVACWLMVYNPAVFRRLA